MTNIDQFESIFRSATQERFEVSEISVWNILIVSDAEAQIAEDYKNRIDQFLGSMGREIKPKYQIVDGSQFNNVEELLAIENEINPDLVCTYRNLRSSAAANYPYSLGVYIDVLAQKTKIPVLLTPRAEQLASGEKSLPAGTKRVMAITDHMSGQHHLVNMALRFVENQGELFLTHVEDEQTFDRYMETISKIAEIDSDMARTAIQNRLLLDPTEYIQSCKQVIDDSGMGIDVHSIVQMGHHLNDYKRLLDENEIDLLVMQTKDDDQLAMHGMAYPLTVEFRETPLLLL